jgi:hypothetical protein
MEPEEMDVVELVETVQVEPSWNIKPDVIIRELAAGTRGMVVHLWEGTPHVCDVEFLDPGSQEACVLATLPATQLRVVQRDTLEVE